VSLNRPRLPRNGRGDTVPAMIDSRAPRFAAVRIDTGPVLHFVEYGDPGGKPVVFLHGWPDSWYSWSRVLPLLSANIRALAIDQRGFGESDKPDTGYAIPQMAADVIAFLDALALQCATLVGHSFGSFVARRTALARPERVAGLVLIGTGFIPSNAVTRDVQKALRDLPDPIPVDFAREFQASTAYRPLPPDFFDRLIVEALKLPPPLWRRAFDGLLDYDDSPQLGQIAAPTLLLWGDRDALFSRVDQDRFLAALPAARLKVYEETGHCPNWEHPERVAAAIAGLVCDPAGSHIERGHGDV
jgi:pimeloyl-ACP methyl ester carboxylesterase